MATKKTQQYWIDREKEYFDSYLSHKEQIDLRMRKHFESLQRTLNDEIYAFLGRYADEQGITMKEARKRIDQFDAYRFSKKVEDILKQGNLTPQAKEQLKLYNLTMRTNRMELLKLNLDLEVVRTYSNVELDFEGSLFREARQEFERQSAILGTTVGQSHEWIEQLANASYHGAVWSERIWGPDHAERLRSKVAEYVGQIQVLGRNPRRYAGKLAKDMNVSRYNAERLLNSEAARVNTGIKKESLTQVGYKKYKYFAEPTACAVCASLNGKVFDVEDMTPGVNAKPMHPFCYCGILPQASGDWAEGL